MKNRFIKSLLLTVAVGGLMTFSSCENYLDVENPSTLSQEAVFSSISSTQSAVTSIYNQLPGDDGYGARISTLYPNAADDFRVGGDHNALSRTAIAHFGVHPDNTEINRPFLQLYRGIERANIAIKYIPESALYNSGTPADRATMRKLYGEALTLRAQFYHELIRNWGDVPAHFEPSANMPDLYLPKTDRDVIYDQLLADLAIAADLVPWRSESGDPSTRVTKAVVKGLRARIALARGGFSLRPTGGPGSGTKGEMRRGAGDPRAFYEIARNETRDIIQKGENGLNPSFEAVFRSLHGANRQDPTNELIWEVGAFGGNARTDTKLGYANGPRIDAANATYGQANGLIESVPVYFYAFDSIGDSRRDVTLAYFQVNAANQKTLTTPLLMREGKFRKYWTGIAGTNQTVGINWPLLRYADILLMFAEAENELNNGPTPAAIAAYEQVRRRAFAGFENRMGTTPTTKDGFFRAIENERYLEFGGEGIRKYDLLRWNLLETKINETKAEMRAMMNGTGRYANVPQYIYFAPTPFQGPTVTARQEVRNFNLLGAEGSTTPIARVMYQPSTTTVAPDGYTRVSWRAAITEDHITGTVRGFASQFQPGKSELFPLFSGVLNQNFRLVQDYGY